MHFTYEWQVQVRILYEKETLFTFPCLWISYVTTNRPLFNGTNIFIAHSFFYSTDRFTYIYFAHERYKLIYNFAHCNRDLFACVPVPAVRDWLLFQ